MKVPFLVLGSSLVLGLAGCSTAGSNAPASTTASSGCSGFAADSVAATSLTAPFEVVSVEPITQQIGRVRTGTVVGARIAVLADPSLSSQGVNRLLSCRIDAANSDDPLAVEGSRVSVRDTRGGYLIEVTAPQPTVGREVYARAEALAAR